MFRRKTACPALRPAGRGYARLQTRLTATLVAVLALAFLAHAGAVQAAVGWSPIFDYAQSGDTGAVDYLLKKGESIDAVNSGGETILTIAAANGHLDLVELAIASGARIDHENGFGKTALCWAAERGHRAAAERLLQNKADVNHQTRDGMTPLMLAVRAGRAPIVQLLLRHKADMSLQDYTGKSVLDWARDGRDRRIEEMLRRAGAGG